MILLIIASIWSWSIIIHKTLSFKRIRQKLSEFEASFWGGSTLDNLYEMVKKDEKHPCSEIFMAAMQEWKHSVSKKALQHDPQKVLIRMEKIMETTMNKELEGMSEHLGFLSSLGTNGVIVGLLGTVLGILDSFQSIVQHQNTSLMTVAPSIAEALFATAIGLIAALPAALFYNKFAFMIRDYQVRLDDFVQNFIIVISRQLDSD